MIVTSVQIKTAKTQKHLYCLVFTRNTASLCHDGLAVFFCLSARLRRKTVPVIMEPDIGIML